VPIEATLVFSKVRYLKYWSGNCCDQRSVGYLAGGLVCVLSVSDCERRHRREIRLPVQGNLSSTILDRIDFCL